MAGALGFRPDRHDAWQYGRGRQEGRNWKTHHRSSVGVRSSINVREVSLFTLSGTLVAGVAQAEVLAERLPSRGRIDNGSLIAIPRPGNGTRWARLRAFVEEQR